MQSWDGDYQKKKIEYFWRVIVLRRCVHTFKVSWIQLGEREKESKWVEEDVVDDDEVGSCMDKVKDKQVVV